MHKKVYVEALNWMIFTSAYSFMFFFSAYMKLGCKVWSLKNVYILNW